MSSANKIQNKAKVKSELEKEINKEYEDIFKEMVKEKIKKVKGNEYKIESIKQENKEIEKDIDDILSGKKKVTEKELLEYKGNRDFKATIELD